MGFHRGVIASPQNRDPDAPTNLVVTQGNQSFNLSWASPYADPLAVNITDYRVQYKTEAGGAVTWATIPDGVSINTTATLSNSGGSYFTLGTSYVFRVAAIIGGSLQGLYSAASAARVFAGVPGKVSKPSTAVAYGGINVSWPKPSENYSSIVSYTLQYSANNGAWTTYITGVPQDMNNPVFGVVGLTPGASYRFRVAATNSIGTGEYSDPSDAVVFFDYPTWPSGPTITAGDCEITINWPAADPKGNTITGYRLYVASAPPGSSAFGNYVDYGIQSSGYKIQHRNNNTTFVVQVAVEFTTPTGAAGSPGYSPASNQTGPRFETQTAPTASIVPGYPNSGAVNQRPARVSFTPNARNISSITLAAREGTTNNWVATHVWYAGGTRTEDIFAINGAGLVANGTYQFSFFIQNTYGDVAQSPAVTYTGSAPVPYNTWVPQANPYVTSTKRLSSSTATAQFSDWQSFKDGPGNAGVVKATNYIVQADACDVNDNFDDTTPTSCGRGPGPDNDYRSTSVTLNNRYFVIQQSTDGANWSQIFDGSGATYNGRQNAPNASGTDFYDTEVRSNVADSVATIFRVAARGTTTTNTAGTWKTQTRTQAFTVASRTSTTSPDNNGNYANCVGSRVFAQEDIRVRLRIYYARLTTAYY